MDHEADRSALAELTQITEDGEAELTRRALDFLREEPPRHPAVWALTRKHPIGRLDGAWEEKTVALPEYAPPYFERVLEILAAGKMPVVMASEDQLTTQEAARLLGISRPTLLARIKAGELSVTWVGTHRRLRAADVEAYRLRMQKP